MYLFLTVDGTTKSPDKFTGPIGSQLEGCVSDWDIYPRFKAIPNVNISLPNDVVDTLSTDQYYLYRIALAVSFGHADIELAMLEVGPLNHYRWLTLACRTLRKYLSCKKPTKNLVLVVQFIMKFMLRPGLTLKRVTGLLMGSKTYLD